MLNNVSTRLPSPWPEFLLELDALLTEEVRVHCIGGIVVTLFHGLPRPTGDLDYYCVSPVHCDKELLSLAGPDSALWKKYKLQLQHVGVNSMPEDYDKRLVEMFPGLLKNLRLYAPDPYDLILSKLERHSTKDRDDVEYLARTLDLKPELLSERYQKELRPYFVKESTHDLTLKLWIESCFKI